MAEHLKHIVLESGIHQFVWLDNSGDVAYEHAAYFEELTANLLPGEVFRLIIDMRQSGIPPFKVLTEVLPKARIRKDINYRTAYLSSDTVVPLLMRNLLMSYRTNGTREFFNADEEQKAIEWLLQG